MENNNNSSVAENNVKHYLELTIGSKKLVESIEALSSVKADAVLFYPTKTAYSAEENGKTVNKRVYQISKTASNMATATRVEFAVKVFGVDGNKPVQLEKVVSSDLKAIFSANELIELCGCIKEIDTVVKFLINTTDKTCTVDINAGKKDGVISAVNMLPMKKEAPRFDIGGTVVASCELYTSKIRSISAMASSMTANAEPQFSAAFIGFGGPGLKWLTTNSRLVSLGEVKECGLKPFDNTNLFGIETKAFATCAGFASKAQKARVELIAKENAEGVQVPNHVAFTIGTDNEVTMLTVQIHDPNHNGGMKDSLFTNFKDLLTADASEFCAEGNRKASASFTFDADEAKIALRLMNLNVQSKGVVELLLANDSTDIPIKEYSRESAGKLAHSKIKGKVKTDGEVDPVVFSSAQLSKILDSLSLKNIEDADGKVIGKEKVTCYVKPTLNVFTGAGTDTYIGVTHFSREAAEKEIKANEEKSKEASKETTDKK